MSIVSTFKQQATPPSPLAGRLAAQSLLFALGEGAFMAGSAVFFTQVVGLTVVQVGLGLTVAGIASFIAAYPMGRIVDRLGAKRCWSIGSFGQGAMFAVWPFIDTFEGYVMMAVAMEVVGALGNVAHGAYTIDVLPPHERVKSRAYMYSALNAGFTAGSLIGVVALGPESLTLLMAMPIFTSVVFLFNAFNITRLPDAAHDMRTAEERQVKIPGPGPMKNVGWLLSSFFHGVLWTNQVILNIVIPLWLVDKTDAPWVILSLLFGTNTVMCIVLPMAAARGVKDVTTALRAIRISTVFFVASCVITLSTHHTAGLWTIALFFVGHVTLTGGELFLSAASWTFEAELMDPRRRGEYQGAAELSGTLGKVWAPAAFTFLAMSWSTWGWLVIAGLITIAAAALHPTTAMARRFLEEHVPAGVLADAAAHDVEVAPVGPPMGEQPAEPGGASPLDGLPESTRDLIR